METLPFKPFSSGIRTLWVLKFLPRPPDLPPPPKPPVDFYIPSPYGNEWFNTNPENTAKAQKILKQIQDTCQDIKTRATVWTNWARARKGAGRAWGEGGRFFYWSRSSF